MNQFGIDHGGGGHGGGGHGGGHGGGGYGHREGHGRWGGSYIVAEPRPAPTESCAWGNPVRMTPDLIAAGQHALEESGAYPAFGYAGETLYRFTIRDGSLVARPCMEPGVVGDSDGILPFLPSGLTRALGLPPPEAAKLLNALGYAATLVGVRTFQVAQGLPDTGIVDDATMTALLHAVNAAAGLGDPPTPPDPTGAPLFDGLKDWVNQAIALPGELLRAGSREFEREIASMKASGSVSDPPPSVQPMGQGLKSIETPDYLRTSVRSLY